MKQYEQNRFVQPAATDPQRQFEFDRPAYSLPSEDWVNLPTAQTQANRQWPDTTASFFEDV